MSGGYARAPGSPVHTVLVADADLALVRFVEDTLRVQGFRVNAAHDGARALDSVRADPPDLAIIDADLPIIDGVEVTRRLRADSRTSTLPVILLGAGASPSDRVLGLRAGADDYLAKPPDASELAARVQATLRRHAEARALSPLTSLPGNVRIEQEIAARVRAGVPFAVAYLDLDNFKAFNDAYGFLRGDDVIQALAAAMRRTAMDWEPPPFLGHVGGDDFVIVCHPDQAEDLCRQVVERFDAASPGLHNPRDAERGYIEIIGRQGSLQRYPLVSVSVGIATTQRRSFADHREAVSVATEMKSVAKGEKGSAIAVDRRSVVGH